MADSSHSSSMSTSSDSSEYSEGEVQLVQVDGQIEKGNKGSGVARVINYSTESISEDDHEETYVIEQIQNGHQEEEETPEIAERPQSLKKTVIAKKKAAASDEPVASTSKASTSNSAAASQKKASEKGSKMRQGSTKAMTTKDMIINAVSDLKNRKGSTSQAIKKYLTDHYDASDQRIRMVTKLLRTADEEGWLEQISGTGVSAGSHFKLPSKTKKTEPKEKEAAMNGKEEKAGKTKKTVPKEKKQAAVNGKEKEAAKSKAKTATKRKMEKPGEKEAPAKKKKTAAEAPKKKAMAAATKKKATTA